MNAHRIIGKDIPRADGRAKATGQAIYADDIKLPGMLYGKLLRSPLPHARILSIDTRKAAAMPGVHCVITGQDIPRVTYGNWRLFPGTQDEYALAMDKVRFIGDEVAAVAAVDRETAEAALERDRVRV
jgi:CO/xanthine dehydrogenase Mo-binding subunit